MDIQNEKTITEELCNDEKLHADFETMQIAEKTATESKKKETENILHTFATYYTATILSKIQNEQMSIIFQIYFGNMIVKMIEDAVHGIFTTDSLKKNEKNIDYAKDVKNFINDEKNAPMLKFVLLQHWKINNKRR